MRTIPLHISPSLDDAVSLNRARALLASQLDQQAHRERAVVAGTATHGMIDAAIADKHLSRVLAGPRPMYRPTAFKQRGSADVLLLIAICAAVAIAIFAVADRTSDNLARRTTCATLAHQYLKAAEGSVAEERARRAMSAASCYVEEATP